MNEDQIQREVFRHLKQRGADGVFAFHPKNGGGHQMDRRAAINATLGVVSGVPDIIAIKGGHVFALELKADKGRVSPKQTEVLDLLLKAGAVTGVAWGLNQALTWLEMAGLLKGRTA